MLRHQALYPPEVWTVLRRTPSSFEILTLPTCLQSYSLWPPGVSSEFIVNTLNAGSGALAVTIDGPSKVQLDCRECPEGHVVTYTPMAPGNYLIAIKYGGPQHIVGSPFKAKVTGKDTGRFPAWLGLGVSGGHSHPCHTYQG